MGRILVVDDDADIQEMVQIALEDEGYEVTVAAHGMAALEILQQLTPRLILLDMRMPVMNGWQFAQAYRERPGEHAPIVLLTAADASTSARQVGAEGYLAKPFDLSQLIATVAKFAA